MPSFLILKENENNNRLDGGSSIYMWAYTGEKFISPTASKFSPGVISHMVLKGGVQGF